VTPTARSRRVVAAERGSINAETAVPQLEDEFQRKRAERNEEPEVPAFSATSIISHVLSALGGRSEPCPYRVTKFLDAERLLEECLAALSR